MTFRADERVAPHAGPTRSDELKFSPLWALCSGQIELKDGPR